MILIMTLLKSSVKNRHTPCTGMEKKYKKAKRYRCIVHILGNTLEYLLYKDTIIDDTTRETYNYYVAELKKKTNRE